MKAVLISIQPKWVEKIANGEKTIEVRKSRPKIETPFKCYIYVTKPKKWFRFSSWGRASDECLWLSNGKVKMCDGFEFWADGKEYEPLCCKVIGEFVCDKVYNLINAFGGIVFADENLNQLEPQLFRDMSCLTDEQTADYLGDKDGYGLHISDLTIYDSPKELSEFFKPCDRFLDCCTCRRLVHNEYMSCDNKITRPPLSWQYVEEV